ncbi:hypothetical protein BCS42_14205 [Crenothrix sp. D3]|nr:hypothetical protein BCS42_14205 [Crenothrix sp. D3]
MKKKSKIDKLITVVVLRDGSKWIISSFDESTVKSWSSLDEIESETFGLDRGLHNLTRDKKIKAEPV